MVCSWLEARRAWRTTVKRTMFTSDRRLKFSNQRCHVESTWPSGANMPKYGVLTSNKADAKERPFLNHQNQHRQCSTGFQRRRRRNPPFPDYTGKTDTEAVLSLNTAKQASQSTVAAGALADSGRLQLQRALRNALTELWLASGTVGNNS